MPKFSIIIPVYKVEDYLRECVESVLHQKYTDFEIILIDDGSPDSCPAICDEYAAKDSRIKVIHKKNTGVSDSRNCGIEAADGEYFWFVDSDDYITEDALITAVEYFDSDIDVLNFKNITIKSDNTLHNKNTRNAFSGLYCGEHKNNILARANTNGLLRFCWHNIYKASLIKNENIRFDKRLSYGEDSVFNLEVFLKAEKIFFSDEHIYVYRDRFDSVSKKINKEFDMNFFNQLKLNCRIRDELYEKYCPAVQKDFYEDKSEFIIKSLFLYILAKRVYKSSSKKKFRIFRKISSDEMIRDAFKYYDINKIKSNSLDWWMLWAIKNKMYFTGHLICKYILYR